MKCAIYRGKLKPESFLYIESVDDFSRVPEALVTMFGDMDLLMELDLASRSKLANADIDEVKQLLKEQGYYLQMPPDINVPRI